MKFMKSRIEDLDFGVLGVICAFILLFALLVPGAVISNGQSISLNEISDSIRASNGRGYSRYFCERIDWPLADNAF